MPWFSLFDRPLAEMQTANIDEISRSRANILQPLVRRLFVCLKALSVVFALLIRASALVFSCDVESVPLVKRQASSC